MHDAICHSASSVVFDNSRLPDPEGPWRESRKAARAAVALLACKRLYEIKELDEHLAPVVLHESEEEAYEYIEKKNKGEEWYIKPKLAPRLLQPRPWDASEWSRAMQTEEKSGGVNGMVLARLFFLICVVAYYQSFHKRHRP